MGSQVDSIIEAIGAAREAKKPLLIRGGNTKHGLLGRHCDGQILDVSAHKGIVDLQASELVLTVLSGTTLKDIDRALAPLGLELPFEPPHLGEAATIGGTLACNLSGPARPWRGSIRDAVLGVQLVNGKAELLNFGGKVMKNVAGYDVSRLQAGALGTLGVITEISLKLLPRAQSTTTLVFEMSAADAIQTMNQRAAQPKPLSGAVWVDGKLYLRLAGAAAAVAQTATHWGGEQSPEAQTIWTALNQMTVPFFAHPEPIWRASLKSTAPHTEQFGEQLIDWGGAQRWLRGNHDKAELERYASDAGGHITLFRGGDRRGEVRHSLDSIQRRLQARLKHSFDPDEILNPGRLYSWM
jgi:glycolate oxidase FAD binding subunit